MYTLNRVRLLSHIGVVVIIGVYCRGLFELFLTKNIGYIFGALGCGGYLASVILSRAVSDGRINAWQLWPAVLFFAYLLAALASLVATFLSGGNELLALIYTAEHLFLMAGTLTIQSNSQFRDLEIIRALRVIAIIVISTGVLEYFRVVTFPGSWELGDYARIAGSLGSKQHFGYASACIGVLLIYAYQETKNNITCLIGVMCILLSFASMSRNGLPVIIGAFSLYLFFSLKKNKALILRYSTVFILFLAIIYIFDEALLSAAFDRVVSIFSFEDRANSLRVEAWMKGVAAISQGNGFFGTETGIYSQAGDRLGLANSSHFESTILQQFANFGVAGGVSFIIFFIFLISGVRSILLKSLAIMMFANYFYYPGGESLPFIASWFLLLSLDNARKAPE